MPENLFTFETLATLGGAALLTFLIVQYTKAMLDRVLRFSTDQYAVIVGAIVLLLAQLANGAYAGDWRVYVLSLFNGFLVALAAGKLNDVALKPPSSRKEGE